MFEEPGSRGEVNEWRKRWAHSPRQYDYAGTVVTRILNWAWKDAGKIRQHHCQGFRKVYEVDRSEIVWTPAHQEVVAAVAPLWVRRILTAACETGLRPGDLVRLSRSHIETTPRGRRIRVRTNKRKRTATIPVTPAMAAVLDATPEDRLLILDERLRQAADRAPRLRGAAPVARQGGADPRGARLRSAPPGRPRDRGDAAAQRRPRAWPTSLVTWAGACATPPP